MDPDPLLSGLIKSIHQHLLSFGRDASKSPGAFKKEQNYIGDMGRHLVHFIPISPQSLESGLDRLLDVMRDDKEPIRIRTALSHVEFEALHPFEHGNGRVGRMLITLLLWTGGAISSPHFFVSRYLEDHKNEYIQRMRDVSASGDWNAWCGFFLTAIAEQAIHDLAVAGSIRSLYETMKDRFAEVLSSKWSVKALDFAFTYPVFRNNRFTKQAGIPSATAARFTRILLDRGLLQTVMESSGRRPAIYRFEPLMKLVRV